MDPMLPYLSDLQLVAVCGPYVLQTPDLSLPSYSVQYVKSQ